MCKCVVFQFIFRKTKRFSYSDNFYNNNRRKQFSDRTKTNWCQFTTLVATRQMKRTITGFLLSDLYTVFANLPRLMIQIETQCLQFVQKVLLILQCFLRIYMYFMLIISISINLKIDRMVQNKMLVLNLLLIANNLIFILSCKNILCLMGERWMENRL